MLQNLGGEFRYREHGAKVSRLPDVLCEAREAVFNISSPQRGENLRIIPFNLLDKQDFGP